MRFVHRLKKVLLKGPPLEGSADAPAAPELPVISEPSLAAAS